ncbi:MAG: 4Fe-4S binding protein [Spirochaetales bacterium]
MRRFSKGIPLIGWVRRILGGIVLVLFVYGFLGWGSLSRNLAGLLPRTQIGPSILRILDSGLMNAAFFILLLLSGSTVLFGRWYCAVLCPLGTAQQLVSPPRMKLGGRLFRKGRLGDWLRYGVAGLAGILLIWNVVNGWRGSAAVVDLLDPYALWGRILRDLVFPLIVFLNWILFRIARLFEVYVPLLSYQPDLPVFFATLFLGGIWIVLSRYRGRVYCASLCPVGTLLGFGARFSLYRIQIDGESCIRCGTCSMVCPTGALSRDPAGPVRLDPERCVLCMNCIASCPSQALRYGRTGGMSEGERVPQSAASPTVTHVSRRAFLGKMGRLSLGLGAYLSLAGLGAAVTYGLAPDRFLFRKRSLGPSLKPNLPSTPPGSLGTERFTSLCISCHLCVSHCPTGVLSPSLFEYGARGLFQPVMDYERGFCEYECTRCGEVCPTGAILPLSVGEKKTVQIGRVLFEQERCVVVTRGTICGACAEVCPTHAVGMVPYRDGLDIPSTDNALCVGCGSCEHACPVPQKAIYVEGQAVHGKAEVREPVRPIPEEPEKKEFPF